MLNQLATGGNFESKYRTKRAEVTPPEPEGSSASSSLLFLAGVHSPDFWPSVRRIRPAQSKPVAERLQGTRGFAPSSSSSETSTTPFPLTSNASKHRNNSGSLDSWSLLPLPTAQLTHTSAASVCSPLLRPGDSDKRYNASAAPNQQLHLCLSRFP